MANRLLTGVRWKYSRNAPSQHGPATEILPVATGYGTTIYSGDFVKLLSTGMVVNAAVGDAIYGICDGVEQYYDGTVVRKGASLPSGTAYGTNLSRQSLLRVIPVRQQVFELDANDGSSAATLALAQALVGENVEWAVGTPSGDQSGIVMNISTHATTNTLSLRILGIQTNVDQDFASTGAKYLLMANLIQDIGSGSTTGT